MSFLALTLLALAPETAGSIVEVEVVERTVLVLPLKTEGEELRGAAKLYSDIVASALGGRSDLKVVTQADLQQMVELEADRRVAGCDESSCLEELADAIGAELVLYGRVEKLGATELVSLSLFSQRKATSVARETAQGTPDELPPKLRALALKMFPLAAAAEGGPPKERADLTPWYIGGGSALAVGTAVALAGMIPLNDPAQPKAAKEGALVAGWAGILTAATGAVIVGVVFGLGGR